MATELTCSGCDEPLADHCEHCSWLACDNRDCTHRFYDLDRGVLLMRDGTVEVMGT